MSEISPYIPKNEIINSIQNDRMEGLSKNFESQNDKLRNLGVDKILAFGSSVTGEADAGSDLDIVVIHDPLEYVEPEEHAIKKEKFKSEIKSLVDSAGMGISVFSPRDVEQIKPTGEAIHVTTQINSDKRLDDKELPAYVEEHEVLWDRSTTVGDK